MLDQIVREKRMELVEKQQAVPHRELLARIPEQPAPSLSDVLREDRINIIAEIKYRSPSRGDFSCKIPPRDLARIYTDNGAVSVSVLTDEKFFGGSLENLHRVRQDQPELPLLRKDFIIDRYQVTEARVHGASAYLLIVSCLDPGPMHSLIEAGVDLGMEPLVEVHDPFELEAAMEGGAEIIGVNNRDLRTFDVRIETSFDLARRVEGESGVLLVSESGISERTQLLELRDAGFHGFLIGTSLVESDDPALVMRSLTGREG